VQDKLEGFVGFVGLIFGLTLLFVIVFSPILAVGVVIDMKACDNIDRINDGKFEFVYSFPSGCLTKTQDGRWVPVGSVAIFDGRE